MSDEDRPAEKQQPSVEARATTKKPYHKPSFRREKVFETQALSCGKVQMGSTCAMNKKIS
jgi:hypothetical protein